MAKPLVLIVEDELGLLRLFGNLVQRLGYDVLQADGGVRALEILETTVPDLMILDIAMPEVSGTEVLHYTIGEPRLDPMMVMVLTALGSKPNLGDMSERVALWTKKPILPNDFLALVQQLVEG